MKLYHTFQSRFGFNIDQYDFERGLFCTRAWSWGEFVPNDFGDKVVELDVTDKAKIYNAEDQLDVLEKELPNDPNTQRIIQAYMDGKFVEREDWHKLDKSIGILLRRKGYQMIHYTEDSLYREVWAIIDRRIIQGIRFGPETK